MTTGDVLFGLFGVVAVGAALYAVTSHYLLRSILSLGAFLTAVAGEFYLLGADFVALVQIFVYVGGVLVLMLFGLMLSEHAESHPLARSRHSPLGIVLAYAAAAGLIWAALDGSLPGVGEVPEDSVSFLGRVFLEEQLFAFELIGMILFAAVVTALVIVRGERQ